MNNYSRTLLTQATAHEAYAALTTGFSNWWTTPEGLIRQVGDRAKFTFPPGVSYWTFEAVKLVQNQHVELACIDAFHKHEGQPEAIETEWRHSRLVWQIKTIKNKTHLHMEHHGLVPGLLCYEICEAGWDHFFGQSLQMYLDTGKGLPHIAG